MDSLFDISNREHKPELEDDKMSLADQRTNRRLQIGSLDHQTTARWQRRAERQGREVTKRCTIAYLSQETTAAAFDHPVEAGIPGNVVARMTLSAHRI